MKKLGVGILIMSGWWVGAAAAVEDMMDPQKQEFLEKQELPMLQERYEVHIKEAKRILESLPDTWEGINSVSIAGEEGEMSE